MDDEFDDDFDEFEDDEAFEKKASAVSATPAKPKTPEELEAERLASLPPARQPSSPTRRNVRIDSMPFVPAT
jgi:hypothetical protein